MTPSPFVAAPSVVAPFAAAPFVAAPFVGFFIQPVKVSFLLHLLRENFKTADCVIRRPIATNDAVRAFVPVIWKQLWFLYMPLYLGTTKDIIQGFP